MKARNIPFVKLVDIQESENSLSLEYKEDVLNHVKTIHASAQFTLAETQSGVYLQSLFPELEGKVIPLLRDAKIKYKKPAECSIVTFADVTQESLEKFQAQFSKKGRASIEVNVVVQDANDVVTAQATFSWFVTKIV